VLKEVFRKLCLALPRDGHLGRRRGGRACQKSLKVSFNTSASPGFLSESPPRLDDFEQFLPFSAGPFWEVEPPRWAQVLARLMAGRCRLTPC